jgi:outer membrane protein assembly factor BamB
VKRQKNFQILAICGLVCIAFILAGCSADWPSYRHNSLRTGAQLNHGPLTDPNKVQTLHVGWTFPTAAITPAPGPFRAGPIVWKGVVYIGNSNGHFYAIDAGTGALKWQYPAANAQALTSTFTCNPSSEGIASSATFASINGKDAIVFGAPDQSIGQHLGSGRLFALDAGTGAEIWKSPEVAVLLNDGVTHQQIGYSSPLVFNDHVYIGIADHCDNPIQQGKIVAVKLADGTIDAGFSFAATGPPRGGGIWGSPAGWDDVYTNTGNSNIGGAEPVPDHALSLLRLNKNTGSIVWKWQPVPYALDDDPDWSATPTVVLGSCGTMAVSVQKDGWTWAVNAGNGTAGPASVRWAFPPGPWSSTGFHAGDGTTHGDTRYLRPGAAWDDVYIVQTGGLDVTADVGEGFRHLYGLNSCASNTDRIRWIKDVPGMTYSSGGYTLGPPSVTHGVIFVGTNQGHVVAIADPSIFPAAGWRCSDPDVPSNICVANGFQLVPDPAVLIDLPLNAGQITNEIALVGDPVYVATDGGKVIMLQTN